MDCVGCEKCRLWGKLQALGATCPPPEHDWHWACKLASYRAAGIATALKILFSSSDCSGDPPGSEHVFGQLTLERNEVRPGVG